MWMISLGANYDVLEDKGTIPFNVNDIFESIQFPLLLPLSFCSTILVGKQYSYLGFNYQFGRGKNKAKSRKK
jgi:hypothetical protein